MHLLARTSGFAASARSRESSAPSVAHRRFFPVTDQVVRWHLSSQDADGQPFVAGVYPLLLDESRFFLAVDFDKAGWQDDSLAFMNACRRLDLPAALERSRSRRRAHVLAASCARDWSSARRGRIYVAGKHPVTAEQTLGHVVKRVPDRVFCLLKALRFHELTTQAPAEVWIALAEKARRPKLDYPRLGVALLGPGVRRGRRDASAGATGGAGRPLTVAIGD